MKPTLPSGTGLVGVRGGRVRPDQLRVMEHPRRPDFWMVKRVTEVGPRGMWVRADNDDTDSVDSRELGWIATRGSYRVVWHQG